MMARKLAKAPAIARLYDDGAAHLRALRLVLSEHDAATSTFRGNTVVDEVAVLEQRVNVYAVAFRRATQAVQALPANTPLRGAVLLAWAGDDAWSERLARYRERIAERTKANTSFAFQVAATVEAMLDQLAAEDPLYRVIEHDVLAAIESDVPEVHRLLRERKSQLAAPVGKRMRPAHVLRETQKQLVALGEQASVRVDLPRALPRTWAAMTALYGFLDEQLQPSK